MVEGVTCEMHPQCVLCCIHICTEICPLVMGSLRMDVNTRSERGLCFLKARKTKGLPTLTVILFISRHH